MITLLELRRSLAELNDAHEQLDKTRRESDELLLNILPATIADELKESHRVEPRYYKLVTIMFTDFKGFTRFAESMEPRSLVQDLDQHFSAFDEIIGRHNLEKLKTIGDAYMCAGGLPEVNRRHPIDACLAALEIQDYMETVNRSDRPRKNEPDWVARNEIPFSLVNYCENRSLPQNISWIAEVEVLGFLQFKTGRVGMPREDQ